MKKPLLTMTVFLVSMMLNAAAMASLPGNEETQLWQLIKDSLDIQELDVYLETYPEGKYVKKVRAKKWAIVKSEQNIKQIEDYVSKHPQSPYLDEAEDTIWKLVKTQENIPLVEEYLKKYPNSRYRKEAQALISQIEEKNRWLTVKKTNTIEQLKTYIKSNPDNRFRTEAMEMLWHIVKNSHDTAILGNYVKSFPGTKLAYKAEGIIWELVEATNDIYSIRKYLAQNPSSRFRGLAKLKLVRLTKRAETLQLSETLILDQVTRLIWQRRNLGQTNWTEAKKLCRKSRLQEWENWRLPNKEELKSLLNIKHFIPDFQFTDYWTDITYKKDQHGAWMVSLNLPLGNVDYKKNRHYVLCVRDLQ